MTCCMLTPMLNSALSCMLKFSCELNEFCESQNTESDILVDSLSAPSLFCIKYCASFSLEAVLDCRSYLLIHTVVITAVRTGLNSGRKGGYRKAYFCVVQLWECVCYSLTCIMIRYHSFSMFCLILS